MDKFNEDFERESLKDFIYLHEEQMLLEQEYWEWFEWKNRKPANIHILDKDKLLKQDDFTTTDVLPF
jgi:hypothetical protein